MAKNTKNPEGYTAIKDNSLISIDVSKYSGSSIYGNVGTNATGKSTSLISKLNHRVEYDPKGDKYGAGTDATHPYLYMKEDDGSGFGDADTYEWIHKVSSGFGIKNSRNAYIGSYDGSSRSLNGDVNRDTIHQGNGNNNEFMYNAGNIDDYQTNLYDDNDLLTGGLPAVIKTNEDGKIRKFVGIENGVEKWEEISSSDERNTSNTMTKTMNYYSVTVKPMNIREL